MIELNNIYIPKEEKENGKKILEILDQYGLIDKPFICNKKRSKEYEVIVFSKKLITMNIYLNVWTYSIDMEAIDASYSLEIIEDEIFELNILLNNKDKIIIKSMTEEHVNFLKNVVKRSIN